MLYLKVTDLKKSYTSKVLIDGVDCTISKGQKVALVAKNGAGKTTFLQLLLWEEHPADGIIEWRDGLRVSYLAQENRLDNSKTVRDVLYDFDMDEHWEQSVEMDIAINKLNIVSYLDQLVWSLSGGEKKRVALAKALMGNPDMLILDEPTNHLDLSMIEWLERYLKKTHMTLLLVTHDRYFLERVCTDIFELHRGKIVSFPGNYSYYLEKKAAREEHEQQQLHKLKQVYRHELHWMKRAPSGRQTKSTSRETRFAAIEHRYEDNKDTLFQESATLVLSSQKRQLGGKIINLYNIKKSFADKKILLDFSHEFRHNERIGIIGKNGVGKSTFVRVLLGEEIIDAGRIETGETVVFWHYQQKDIEFASDAKVSDIVDNRKLLEQFLFPISQHHILANNLSGGEKRRLHLLSILSKNPNFLILDEPTNDLDLVTIAVLEEFLLQYEGCLVVVSHDRFFMDRIVDHLFVFEGDAVVNDFWGTYTEYSKEKEEQTKKKNNNKSSESRAQSVDDWIEDKPVKKKLSYMEKRELDMLMKDLLKLEARKDEIHLLLDNKDMHYDDIRKLSEELGRIIRLIEQKEYRWFELQG
jgi:ATP-binding cassette subfamily F protein uup